VHTRDPFSRIASEACLWDGLSLCELARTFVKDIYQRGSKSRDHTHLYMIGVMVTDFQLSQHTSKNVDRTLDRIMKINLREDPQNM
jgi:hypothetical protein